MKRIFVIITVISIPFSQAISQCSGANAGPDKSICSGGSTTIGTTAVSGYSYLWTPSTGLSNPSIAQPSANPSSTTNYILTVAPNSLLTNASFENGLAGGGFSTDFPRSPSHINGGYGGAVWLLWEYPAACYTFPTSGSYFFGANAPSSNAANYRIWYTTVTISQNKDYVFKGKMSNTNFTTTPVNVRIIGNSTGLSTTSYSLSGGCNGWQSFSIPWNSGTNTSVTLEFRFTNTCNNNNVLTLDDLFFGLDCSTTTDDVTVNVGSTPSVTPVGPITYYNQYETPQVYTLSCSAASSYQWYKNNVLISGATNQTYDYDFTGCGIGTTTEYFKCVTDCGTSNVVTSNYIGCDDAGDYPVTITPQNICASQVVPPNYFQLATAPNLGTGTNDSWWVSTNNWYNFSVSGSTGHLTGSGVTGSAGVYAKSELNGAETIMFWVINTNGGCRSANGFTNPSPLIVEYRSQVMPNPATDHVRITSSNDINRIEFYNMMGRQMKFIPVNNSSWVFVNTRGLRAGLYSVKIFTDKGVETLKLMIQ